jgi:hypothetical protein
MIQMSDAQIHRIRQQISRQVAFPEELSSTFDESQAHELLQDILACQTDEDLASFTALLPRRRLNDLFGALLVMSAAAGEQAVLRVLGILRARLTPSLAEIGWAFYQHHYPNDRMNRVLSALIQEYRDKGSELPYLQAVAQACDMPAVDDHLPERLAKRLLLKPDIPLGDFFVKMTILPDSPFAAAFLLSYFCDCPDETLQASPDLFVHTLKINAESEQQALVSRYFADHRLKPEWEPINLALLELFGPPRPRQQQKLASLLGHSSDARLWDHLDLAVDDRYRQWYMIHKLNLHIGDSPRKKTFYQKYLMQIRDIANWDDKTLVVHFDRFILADHPDDADRVFYYDLNTFHILSDASHFAVSLNKPAGKTLTARQAMLSGEKINIVCLQLDQVNLLFSRDFIADKLAAGPVDLK